MSKLGLRAYLALNRGLASGTHWLVRAHQVLSELPLVAFREEWARRASVEYFERSPNYGEPAMQDAGLFPFEARMLERFFPKPPAALLLHGCGGGRELVALRRLGYEVEAYEPARSLAVAAERHLEAAGFGPTRVTQCDLQSWTIGASAQVTRPFAGAWLGWSAWGYVLSQRDRLAALRALAQAVPEGPILLSFYRGDAVFDHAETQARPRPLIGPSGTRLQRLTRELIREHWLGAPPLERGTSWDRGFFCHLTEEWELREEAALAGCEVLYYERDVARYPHAVLRKCRQS